MKNNPYPSGINNHLLSLFSPALVIPAVFKPESREKGCVVHAHKLGSLKL